MRLGRQSLEVAARHEHSWWEATACVMLGGTVLLGGDRAGLTRFRRAAEAPFNLVYEVRP